jgi:energy-coupling factor transporter ATP-binding protein EcfA2
MSATDEANATTESAPVVQWIADDEYERDVERLNQQPDQPWPEPVDGALLLRQTFAIIQTYTSIPEAAADLVALFPPASFALYRCKYEYAPRLMIVGEPDSGKSTLMKILAGMCQRPFIMTKAPLFEAIDAQKPTIIIDEAQRNLAEHKDLLTLLHAGYDWNSAITRRKRGSYNTFALAIMAGVGDYGSLELKSRAFIIEMITALEALPHKFVPRFVAPELEEIRRKWLRWTIDNRAPIMDCRPELPLALSRNRLGDVAGILLRIPDVCGGEWPERARNAMLIIAADNPDDKSPGRILLEAIAEIVTNPDTVLCYEDAAGNQTPRRMAATAPFIWTVELLQALKHRHDLPYGSLTGAVLASMLKAYRRAKILPDKVQIPGGRGKPVWRGYHRADFERAFALYGIATPQTARPPDAALMSAEPPEGSHAKREPTAQDKLPSGGLADDGARRSAAADSNLHTRVAVVAERIKARDNHKAESEAADTEVV